MKFVHNFIHRERRYFEVGGKEEKVLKGTSDSSKKKTLNSPWLRKMMN